MVIPEERLEREVEFIPETDRGTLFVLGSSAILEDRILDREGVSPNATLILNLLDYLSGQEDYALMRSKGQMYNPLEKTRAETRTFIKTFNIVGLPVLVLLVGLLVWLRWIAKKRRIQSLFEPDNTQ
jgi:ABC-type uncharacterized transport system involved in gliding motility auxiliary subunit